VSVDALLAVVPADLRPALPRAALEGILAAMVEHELLEAPLGGRHVLSASTERAFARGRVHGNIDDDPGVDVVDRLTGDVIGRVASTRPGDGHVQLGGLARRPVHEAEGVLLTDAGHGLAPAKFRPRAAPALAVALGQAFAADLGAAPDELVQGRHGASIVVLHGLGAIGARFFADLVRERHGRARVLETTPMTLRLSAPLAEVPRPLPEDVPRFVGAREKWLARRLGMGPYHAKLPLDLRVAAVRGASPLDRVAAFLGRARLQERPLEEEVPGFWGDL
jgi:hypothetical protein